MASLSLGLIADTSIQLGNLESIVKAANFSVGAALISRSEEINALPHVDIWVVRVEGDDERSQALVERLDALDVPVIYDDADSYSSLDIEERALRFSKKIAESDFQAQPEITGLARAKAVWVLAASAGGPEAVVRFLQDVPDDINDVAFIYVQHMDENMAEPLRKSLARHTSWQVVYCDKPWVLHEKTIYMVSPQFQVNLSEVGSLVPTQSEWESPYRPSVDQVVVKVWRKFGRDSGVIVFSGMGDDGAKTCRMIKNAGGQVWVQSPDSCAVDSMPNEVVKTECVSFIGSPEQLARHFAVYHRKLNQMLQEQGNQETHYD